MKKIVIPLMLFVGIFANTPIKAQIKIGINLNIGSQPVWGPVGYDYAEYYYLPDIEVYYNVARRQYVYQQNRRWIFSSSLPARARGYDVYRGHKVVINEPQPYLRNNDFRKKYEGYKGRHDQESIRDSRDKKYFGVKGHPQNNKNNNKNENKNENRDNKEHNRRN